MLPQLTPTQFRIFLLLYSAHADYKFSDEEMSIIKTDANEQEYREMVTLFNGVTDFRALKIIMHNKHLLLKDNRTKSDFYNELITLFKSDGDFSRHEKVFLSFLEKMLQTDN